MHVNEKEKRHEPVFSHSGSKVYKLFNNVNKYQNIYIHSTPRTYMCKYHKSRVLSRQSNP